MRYMRSFRLEIATALKEPRKGRNTLKLNACAIREKVIFPEEEVLIGSSDLDSASRQWLSRGHNQRKVKRDGLALISLTKQQYRFCQVGVEARLMKTMTMRNGEKGYKMMGVRRVMLDSVATHEDGGYHSVVVPFQQRQHRDHSHVLRKMAGLKESLTKLLKLSDTIDKKSNLHLRQSLNDPYKFCDFIVSHLTMTYEEQLSLLSSPLSNRLTLITRYLNREIEMLKYSSSVQRQAEERITTGERVNFIKEQISILQSELSNLDGSNDSEVQKLASEIEQVEMPAHVRQVVHRELEKLELVPYGSTDYMISHQYLTWLKDLVWTDTSGDTALPSFRQAKRILNKNHAGLELVKTKILEYLAVIMHKKKIDGHILLLVGAPGVGKTSLARSIADALGRKFAKISLGGMREEMEIRGLRRTYTGAMPGKIIQAIKQVGDASAVILLDEIDKIGAKDSHNDVQASLLEVLDYQQNSAYLDHYIDIPFDLSRILFIATANDSELISAPMLNRLEVIELPSYSNSEKLQIAQKHLLPHIQKKLQIEKHMLSFHDEAVLTLIRDYTQEAGVRQLRCKLEEIARKVIMSLVSGVSGRKKIAGKLAQKDITTFLGNSTYKGEPNPTNLPAGVAIALAYTCNGGEIMHVETGRVQDKNSGIILTGQLGQVMQESAVMAKSYISAHYKKLGIKQTLLYNARLHVHLPDGATPKDGPSAGLAIYLALVSQLRSLPIDSQLVITGEITLRGHVLAVGGIREKLLAALRYRKQTVILPADNASDLLAVPSELLRNLSFYLVKTMDEALAFAGLASSIPTKPKRLTRRHLLAFLKREA